MDKFEIKRYSSLSKRVVPSIIKREKRGHFYYEFFINGKALHRHLEEAFPFLKPLLRSRIGELGGWYSFSTDQLLVWKLTLSPFTFEQIVELFLLDTTNEISMKYHLRFYEDITSSIPIVYTCAGCGNMHCGQDIGVDVIKRKGSFEWRFYGEEKDLSFTFEENNYCLTLEKYLKKNYPFQLQN